MKELRVKWVLFMCSLVVFMVAVSAQAWDQNDVPYPVASPYPVDIDSNYTEDAYIYRPEFQAPGIEENYPIIVFCVGTNAHPYDGHPLNEDGYRNLLSEFASYGIVVIAGTSGNQADGNGQQAVDVLHWLVEENQEPSSEFYDKLDTNRIVSMGHSQGGAASIWVALRAPGEIGVTITAIGALMPGTGTVHGGEEIDYTQISTPILYVGAQWDFVVPPWLIVFPQYNNTDDAPAWFAIHRRSGHFQVPDTMLTTLKAWLYAHLFNQSDAQSVFYGEDWSLKGDSAWNAQRRNF